jgi:hypothetical protein
MAGKRVGETMEADELTVRLVDKALRAAVARTSEACHQPLNPGPSVRAVRRVATVRAR